MTSGVKAAALVLALAYVLPSFGILRRMAGNRDELGLVGLKVEGSAAVGAGAARDVAALLGVEWTSGELPLNYAVSIRFPGRCRVELTSLESTKSLVAVTSNGKRRSEGGEWAPLQVAADQICAVLALHGAWEGESRAAVEKTLGKLKVNLAATSLGRFRGTVAYVVGDVADAGAQLWVYRDHFSPARLRFTDEQQTAWDVQFFDYSSQAAGEWFPRVLVVDKGGEPQLRLTLLKGDGRPKLDDALF